MALLGYLVGSLIDPFAWGIVYLCSVPVWKRKDGWRYFIGFAIPALLILTLNQTNSKEDLMVILISTLLKSYLILLLSNYLNKKSQITS
jgi:uncharacterized membrane protein